MIAKDELIRIARSKGLENTGHAEKDYLLDLFLYAISSETKDELVFKGGTCLYKLHGLDRFSEDIDFSAVKPIDLDALIGKMMIRLRDFGVECELSKKKEPFNSVLLTFHAKGPLYDGRPMTLCTVRMDVNLRSSVELPPKPSRYTPAYPEMTDFTILAMDPLEILAEKIRAVMTRSKARDVYDLRFLLSRGHTPDFALIDKKLEYYDRSWSATDFEDSLEDKRHSWETDLRPLVSSPLPTFDDAKTYILKEFAKRKT